MQKGEGGFFRLPLFDDGAPKRLRWKRRSWFTSERRRAGQSQPRTQTKVPWLQGTGSLIRALSARQDHTWYTKALVRHVSRCLLYVYYRLVSLRVQLGIPFAFCAVDSLVSRDIFRQLVFSCRPICRSSNLRHFPILASKCCPLRLSFQCKKAAFDHHSTLEYTVLQFPKWQ